MTILRADLENMVKEGVVSDIFRAERAISLVKVPGLRAAQINSGSGGFGLLFGTIQVSLNTEALLALARIFDKPSKRNPTRCLRGVLSFLATRGSELPSIKEPHQLEISLRAMNAPPEIVLTVRQQPADFAPKFAAFVEEILGRSKMDEALQKLRTLRDKRLAHNEQVAVVEGPIWAALSELLELAKHAVGVLGWAYFSTAYTVNGEYILTEDVLRPAIALNRLLDQLYGSVPAA